MIVSGEKTWVEISRAAVENNVAALRSFLSQDSEFCAVIKANAYGHGQKEMTEIVSECGVTHFAVDSIKEAILLREQVPNAKIFILGHTVKERLRDVVTINAIQTVYDEETIFELAKCAMAQNSTVQISIKIETGLNRQGVGPRGLSDILEAVKKVESHIHLIGVSSHFAHAEEPGDPMNAFQREHFARAISVINAAGFSPKYKHIACSAAAVTSLQDQGTLSRFGIMLYGLWPSQTIKRHVVLGRQNIEILPALQWKTRIAQIKDVPSGGTIGYSSTFTANRPMRIAILPIGYSDGFDRKSSNRGEVLVRGRRCLVLGAVCMNMTMIDVSAVPGVSQEDVVSIIGRDGMHSISADDLALVNGTIHYEVVTRINPLIPRVIC